MLRPLHPVLAALLATSMVVTAALGWFGWRYFDQQGAVERQRTRERVETGADAIAAGIRGRVAEDGERLSGWVSNAGAPAPVVDGAVVFASSEAQSETSPPHALPFVPYVAPAPGAGPLFAAPEALELQGNDRQAEAAAAYQRLSGNADPKIRAEALLRLGRVTRNHGQYQQSLAAYGALAHLGEVRAGGLPADLVALEGQSLTRAAAGDRAGEERARAEIAHGIDSGRWLLTRAEAEYYREMAPPESKPDGWILAAAIADVWKSRATPAGIRAVEAGGRPVLTMWRSSGKRSAVLAAFADPFLGKKLPAAVGYQLMDAGGLRLSGAASLPAQVVTRVIEGAPNAWVLRVWEESRTAGGHSDRQLLVAMLVAVILFVWSTVYFMARAIRREARVARLQSDFVAAVSHEFRSPLTTVRQLAEMLEDGRTPNEERRRQYYQTVAREARRLQRLVETLLNFGKMEAGAQRYRRQEVDLDELVRRGAREAAGDDAGAAARIRVDAGDGAAPRIHGDEEALAVALRNLVENGLKYSPAPEPVEIAWLRRDGCVAISVTDHGPGIPKAEQEVIFQKFVRGRSALEASIQGTGVGLAMVRHIVAAHGGRVRLASEPGRGATFTVELPEEG